MSFILFEDIVEVQRVDDKHFAKVSRCHCKSDNFDLEIKLDVNTNVFPVSEEDRLNLAIASSLSLDDKPDDGQYDQTKVSLVSTCCAF
jgi:DNA-directed RNA polymerase I, II, and III subunit RPABC3